MYVFLYVCMWRVCLVPKEVREGIIPWNWNDIQMPIGCVGDEPSSQPLILTLNSPFDTVLCHPEWPQTSIAKDKHQLLSFLLPPSGCWVYWCVPLWSACLEIMKSTKFLLIWEETPWQAEGSASCERHCDAKWREPRPEEKCLFQKHFSVWPGH